MFHPISNLSNHFHHNNIANSSFDSSSYLGHLSRRWKELRMKPQRWRRSIKRQGCRPLVGDISAFCEHEFGVPHRVCASWDTPSETEHTFRAAGRKKRILWSNWLAEALHLNKIPKHSDCSNTFRLTQIIPEVLSWKGDMKQPALPSRLPWCTARRFRSYGQRFQASFVNDFLCQALDLQPNNTVLLNNRAMAYLKQAVDMVNVAQGFYGGVSVWRRYHLHFNVVKSKSTVYIMVNVVTGL